MDKKELSERDIENIFITPAIVKAGWDLHNKIRQNVTLTPGPVIVRGEMSARNKKKKKFADYVLSWKPGARVAVIESKDNYHTVSSGMQQTIGYANILGVPNAFSSNGEAYGNGTLDLTKPIPKVLSYHYKTSSLLFLGCSLNRDRTMEVFQGVKTQMGDRDRPQHFSLESMPNTEAELASRNAYLLNFGITPIWFPNGSYEYVEQILRLARNELKYRGHLPGIKKIKNELVQTETLPEKVKPTKNRKILNAMFSLFNKLMFELNKSINNKYKTIN